MVPTTRASLVAAWIGIGAGTAVAVTNPFSRWILLLVPAAIIGALLLWHFDDHVEKAAALIGLSVAPAILCVRAVHGPCSTGADPWSCQSGLGWPWAVAALVLVVTGAAVIATPARRRARLRRSPSS